MANIHGACEVHDFKVQLMELSATIKDYKAAALKTWLQGTRRTGVN